MKRWKRLEHLFHAARALEGSEREAFLRRECGPDAELLAELEGLMPEADTVVSSLADFADTPLPEYETPERIGDYHILREIGEGGMGVVYLAEQEKPFKRRVAIKVIKVGIEFEQVLGRFESEKKVLALMDHPGIAKILDAGATVHGHPYFVMEYVPGPPITIYCDARQLTIDERLELFCEACRAIHHAHQKEIIHRDLKPSNILVHGKGERPIPKVIDFGVARATRSHEAEYTIYTERGEFIGTPEYMSPEQAEPADVDVDARADVYSLGVILYELLSGCLPFGTEELRSRGLVGFVKMIQQEEPPTLVSRIDAMPPEMRSQMARNRRSEVDDVITRVRSELDWITQKAMAKNPADRYQSAADFADDIERLLSNQPVKASRPGTLYRLRKFAQRRRALVASVAVIGLVAALGTFSNLSFYRRATTAESQRDQLLERLDATDERAQRFEDELDRLRAQIRSLRYEVQSLQNPAPEDPDPDLDSPGANAVEAVEASLPRTESVEPAEPATRTPPPPGDGEGFETSNIDRPAERAPPRHAPPAMRDPGSTPPAPLAYARRATGRESLRTSESRSIELGLEWLRGHQDPDGRWDADEFDKHRVNGSRCDGPGNATHDVGVTALAVLAFLGDGEGLSDADNARCVRRGLAWLRAQQRPNSRGEERGLVGAKASAVYIYDHAIATIALCEGYGLLGGTESRRAAQAALDYLEYHRSPEFAWRYEPKASEADTSVTAWCVLACSAGLDFGLDVPDEAFAGAARWLTQATDPFTGETGYTELGEPSGRSSPQHRARFPTDHGAALTAACLHARYLIDGRPGHYPPSVQIDRIAEREPEWDPDAGTVDLSYWFHGAHALNAIGRGSEWLDALSGALCLHQRRTGHAAGSWDPVGVWGENGGRVYSTAMAILCLEAPYRFAPTNPLGYLPDTADFRSIRREWQAGRFDRVHRAMRALRRGDLEPDAQQALRQLERGMEEVKTAAIHRIWQLEKTHEIVLSRHFADAEDELTRIEQSFRGLQPAKEARQAKQRFRTDKDLAAEVRAARSLAELVRKQDKLGSLSQEEARAWIKVYERLVRSHKGTTAAREAQLRIAILRN